MRYRLLVGTPTVSHDSRPSARRATLTGIQLSLLLAFSHSTNDAFSNVLPVFLPTLQARFGLGEAVLAVLVAVISTSSNVMQPFFGGFVDRWGRRRTASIALIVGSTLMGFISVAPNVWSLFFILAIGGFMTVVFETGALNLGIARLAHRFADRGTVLIIVLMVLWQQEQPIDTLMVDELLSVDEDWDYSPTIH